MREIFILLLRLQGVASGMGAFYWTYKMAEGPNSTGDEGVGILLGILAGLFAFLWCWGAASLAQTAIDADDRLQKMEKELTALKEKSAKDSTQIQEKLDTLGTLISQR